MKFRMGFSLCFSTIASQLRPRLVVGFRGIQAIGAEFLYQFPAVDRGTIAAPLFAAFLFPILRSQNSWAFAEQLAELHSFGGVPPTP